MTTFSMTAQEFDQFRSFLYQATGISLSPTKLPLVTGRLHCRLQHHGLTSYGADYRLLTGGQMPDEVQVAVNLLTTNETAFFRESRHFDFLRQTVLPARWSGQTKRVWSAACSSGEEPYTIAMVLADALGSSAWEVLASDISTRVLARAQAGHYPMERAAPIPPQYLKAYCLKGVGCQAGTFLIDSRLRQHVRFATINLNAALPQIGMFEVIFLRNVMIYFNTETKHQVITRISTVLAPGGVLFIGHSESLFGVTDTLHLVQPGIYRKA